ncbi:MAG: hypothetical protein ABI372_08620 [Ginsengibacter sp.]
MEELIKRLQNIHGLNPEQSKGVISTIAGYIKEKFPMVGGAVDNLFQSGTTPSSPGTTPADVQESAANPAKKNTDFLDRISDFIPGAAGENIEEFAKDKLGGFFGGKKDSNQ